METYLFYAITGIILLVAGYFVGYMIGLKKNVSSNNMEEIQANNSMQIPNVQNRQIRAVQTQGRMGTSLEIPTNAGIYKGVKSKNKSALPHLNFARIGIASETEKDNLKKINGIGPFIEQKLNRIGIYTYGQISRFTDYEIDTITELIEFFPGRIKRDNWKQQATVLLSNEEKGK